MGNAIQYIPRYVFINHGNINNKSSAILCTNHLCRLAYMHAANYERDSFIIMK